MGLLKSWRGLMLLRSGVREACWPNIFEVAPPKSSEDCKFIWLGERTGTEVMRDVTPGLQLPYLPTTWAVASVQQTPHLVHPLPWNLQVNQGFVAVCRLIVCTWKTEMLGETSEFAQACFQKLTVTPVLQSPVCSSVSRLVFLCHSFGY